MGRGFGRYFKALAAVFARQSFMISFTLKIAKQQKNIISDPAKAILTAQKSMISLCASGDTRSGHFWVQGLPSTYFFPMHLAVHRTTWAIRVLPQRTAQNDHVPLPYRGLHKQVSDSMLTRVKIPSAHSLLQECGYSAWETTSCSPLYAMRLCQKREPKSSNLSGLLMISWESTANISLQSQQLGQFWWAIKFHIAQE